MPLKGQDCGEPDINQLHAHVKGKLTLDQVLIRLLGVLAVLRELRACDGKVPWVEKGKTALPKEQSRRLFEEIMGSLFDQPAPCYI